MVIYIVCKKRLLQALHAATRALRWACTQSHTRTHRLEGEGEGEGEGAGEGEGEGHYDPPEAD